MRRRCWHHKWKEAEKMVTIHCQRSITQRPMRSEFCVYCGTNRVMDRIARRHDLLLAVRRSIRIIARAQ